MSDSLIPEAELPGAAGSARALYALWYYREHSPVRSLHRTIKFEGGREAGYLAGLALGNRLRGLHPGLEESKAVVVAVPSHPVRIEERGFHHVFPIAQGVAAILGCPLAEDLLCRTRLGPSQTRISAEERAENVSGVFSVDRSILPVTRRCILVDDVITSGATMDAAAGSLEMAGFDVLAAALAIRREPPPGAGWRAG